MFMYDVESLSVESTAVVLSAAIIHFDDSIKEYTDSEKIYNQLLFSGLMVKFNVEEQIKNYKRIIDKDTVEWWSKQHEFVRKSSLTPSEKDLSVKDGFDKIRTYIKSREPKNTIVWARGSLDQMVTDSLCKAAGLEPIVSYNDWRDVRTAVDMTAETSLRGYCELSIPFERAQVIKHHPLHDCAYDVMMLMFPK